MMQRECYIILQMAKQCNFFLYDKKFRELEHKVRLMLEELNDP